MAVPYNYNVMFCNDTIPAAAAESAELRCLFGPSDKCISEFDKRACKVNCGLSFQHWHKQYMSDKRACNYY